MPCFIAMAANPPPLDQLLLLLRRYLCRRADEETKEKAQKAKAELHGKQQVLTMC